MDYTNYRYIRMLPMLDTGQNRPISGGRYYPAVPGQTVDVNSSDANDLQMLGWTPTCPCPCGPSTARPTDPGPGQDSFFLDTTLGYIICFNKPRGYWVNPVTGTQV